jgi:squalene synthase HpnC
MSDLASGKGQQDENFPVASILVHRRHRGVVHAFYNFARSADDVADHPTATADEKLHLLEEMDRTLTGELDSSPEALTLRRVLEERGLSVQHALMLLEAFRRDVTKLRYADWDDLMNYCRYSAMPVGRFVLDVHGESRETWPASDALCAALQVINHLQDCAKDYRDLDRVYIPVDYLARAGIGVEAIAQPKASPALLGVIRELAKRTKSLLLESRSFAGQIRDRRLSSEVAVIQALAENLTGRLMRRDPLSERVHHSKTEAATLALGALTRSLFSRRSATKPPVTAARGS